MTQPRRAKLISAAMNASFVGAVMAGCALGLAASAGADDNCDPLMLSMTPQPVMPCQAPDVAPPPDHVPAVNPVNDVLAPMPVAPPPDQVPAVNPVNDVLAPMPAEAPAPVIPPAPDAAAFGAPP